MVCVFPTVVFLWQAKWQRLMKPQSHFHHLRFYSPWKKILFTVIQWICRLLVHTSRLPFSAALKCKWFQSGAAQNFARCRVTQPECVNLHFVTTFDRILTVLSQYCSHIQSLKHYKPCRTIFPLICPSHLLVVLFFLFGVFFLPCGSSTEIWNPTHQIQTLGFQLGDAREEPELSTLITNKESQLQSHLLVIAHKCHSSRSKY